MGIQLMIIASLFVAMSNYCMRKSVDAGGSSKAFLMIQLSIVCLVAILMNPVRTQQYATTSCMVYFGLAAGLVLALMMICLGRSVEKGPPGLTFATMSSSAVMPALLMVMLFGSRFGYLYNLSHGVGSFFVVAGLFWAGSQVKAGKAGKSWAALVTATFILHALFLVLMQWRALFINFPGENGLFLNFDVEDVKSQWFMPAVFFAAALVQIFVYVATEKKWPKKAEVLFGTLGGITNGLGTFFMIWSTEVASTVEQAMIFPIFSVGIILFCNLWGQWLYKEKVNWLATALCVLGIFIGTMNWSALNG